MKRAVMVVFGAAVLFVFGIVVLISAGSGKAADCGAASGGPSSVAGIPRRDLSYFEGAAAQFGLGSNGWAYLAALNFDESDFDTSKLPGVRSGANPAGAAGPMQIGIGGVAGDSWDTVVGVVPTGLRGGVTPVSVYNEADAVYGAAALLSRSGAPGDWLKALEAWNDYAPEINTVEALAAEWTGLSASSSAAGSGTGTTGNGDTSPTPAAHMGAGTCVAVSGPSVPGAASKVGKGGLAAIPAQAPPAVQAMLAAGNELIDYPYSWGGGHSAASMAIPPGPAVDPGVEENDGAGYDCSSATSFVLWGGGLGESLLHGEVLTSGGFASVGEPGQGQWVTIYAGESGGVGHVFIVVDGVVLDTVHGTRTFPAGSGPRWQPLSDVAFELETGSFTAVHPPGM